MFNSTVLKITGFKKKYINSVCALNNLNIEIENGIIFGLVGPNGAGKSTLINIISGTILQDEGELFFEDEKLLPTDYLYKMKMGFMLENPIYFENLTISEQLKFLAAMYDLSIPMVLEHSKELLCYLELENKTNSIIQTLSTGEKKKFAFICSILHNPKLLIMDEPFENIDPLSRKKMKIVLNKMKEKGTTIFITSHALKEVEDFCDEVAIINKGKIVYQSETKDIRNKIKNEVTNETYQSLEEIFLDLTTENEKITELSWL